MGSKNAAFYLGRTVKVATRPAGGGRVHELCIRGAHVRACVCGGGGVRGRGGGGGREGGGSRAAPRAARRAGAPRAAARPPAPHTAREPRPNTRRRLLQTPIPNTDFVFERTPGEELERRFRAGEAVYEEDLVTRPPGVSPGVTGDAAGGATGGVTPDVEAGFAPAARWLAEEAPAAAPAAAAAGAGAPPGGGGEPGGGENGGGEANSGGGGGGFTRVVVGDLKPDVLAALGDDSSALGVLRDLAHLYHYYTHGPKGNAFL